MAKNRNPMESIFSGIEERKEALKQDEQVIEKADSKPKKEDKVEQPQVKVEKTTKIKESAPKMAAESKDDKIREKPTEKPKNNSLVLPDMTAIAEKKTVHKQFLFTKSRAEWLKETAKSKGVSENQLLEIIIDIIRNENQ